MDNQVKALIDATIDKWPLLAPFAYDSYKKGGRGAVVVNPFQSTDEIGYMTEQSLRDPAAGMDDEILRLLASYDPDTEIFALIKPEPTKLLTLILDTPKGQKTPKEMHETENNWSEVIE